MIDIISLYTILNKTSQCSLERESQASFYKPRIIDDCKNLRTCAHVNDLRSAQEESDYGESRFFYGCVVQGSHCPAC